MGLPLCYRRVTTTFKAYTTLQNSQKYFHNKHQMCIFAHFFCSSPMEKEKREWEDYYEE